MEKIEAQELLDHFSEAAKRTLERFGNHSMITLAFGPNGHNVIGLDPMLQNAERLIEQGAVQASYEVKDLMAEILKKTLKGMEAFGVVIICEIWMRHAKEEDLTIIEGDEPGKKEILAQPPRFFPDRIEALSLRCEFKLSDGHKFTGNRVWPFWRVRKKIAIGPVEEFSKEEPTGRFTNLIE